jgi:hypothetical protein
MEQLLAGAWSIWKLTFPLAVVAPPTCLPPTGLAVTGLTGNGAIISWATPELLRLADMRTMFLQLQRNRQHLQEQQQQLVNLALLWLRILITGG